MIAAASEHIYAGALGAALRVVVVLLVVTVMSVMIWAMLVGSVTFVDWLSEWRRERRRPKVEPPRVRPPQALDPFQIEPQLGGTYHVVNRQTGELVGTAGWRGDAERLCSTAALEWYRAQRTARGDAE